MQEAVLAVVAAVLHLGNIEFAQNTSDEAVLAFAAAQDELETVASLLQVNIACIAVHCRFQAAVQGGLEAVASIL